MTKNVFIVTEDATEIMGVFECKNHAVAWLKSRGWKKKKGLPETYYKIEKPLFFKEGEEDTEILADVVGWSVTTKRDVAVARRRKK